ncbi:MAG: prefoldin subunit beta [Candidatus Micrarchaeota archaeon]|nr:prefoldin subunit beta [Candidatus Micrarchaeota archaeon]
MEGNEEIELQSLQQQLQIISLQKQQMKIQSDEIDHALKEVENAKGDIYRLVGPILLKSSKEEVVKDLNDKKATLEARLQILEKQEDRIRKQLSESKKKG